MQSEKPDIPKLPTDSERDRHSTNKRSISHRLKIAGIILASICGALIAIVIIFALIFEFTPAGQRYIQTYEAESTAEAIAEAPRKTAEARQRNRERVAENRAKAAAEAREPYNPDKAAEIHRELTKKATAQQTREAKALYKYEDARGTTARATARAELTRARATSEALGKAVIATVNALRAKRLAAPR